MLSRLRVKNFRLLRDVDVEFHEDVTVFVGPNASGKSTVLEVLDFLSRCANDGLQEAVTAHGGLESIRTAGVQGPIEIEVRWSFELRGRPWNLDWSVAISHSRSGAALVEREVLSDSSREPSRALLTTNDEGIRLVSNEKNPKGALAKLSARSM